MTHHTITLPEPLAKLAIDGGPLVVPWDEQPVLVDGEIDLWMVKHKGRWVYFYPRAEFNVPLPDGKTLAGATGKTPDYICSFQPGDVIRVAYDRPLGGRRVTTLPPVVSVDAMTAKEAAKHITAIMWALYKNGAPPEWWWRIQTGEAS